MIGAVKSLSHSVKKKAARIIGSEKTILEKAALFKGSSGVTTNSKIRKFGEALRFHREDTAACNVYIDCLGRTLLMPPGKTSAWADSRSLAVEELHKSFWLMDRARQDRITTILQEALGNKTNPAISRTVQHDIVDALRSIVHLSDDDPDDDITTPIVVPSARGEITLPPLVLEAEAYSGASGVTTNSRIKCFGDALRGHPDQIHKIIFLECLGRTILMASAATHTWPTSTSRCLAVQELYKSYGLLNVRLKKLVRDILQRALDQHNKSIDTKVREEITRALDYINSGEHLRSLHSCEDRHAEVPSDSHHGSSWKSESLRPLLTAACGVALCSMWKVDFIVVYAIIMVAILVLSWKSRSH